MVKDSIIYRKPQPAGAARYVRVELFVFDGGSRVSVMWLPVKDRAAPPGEAQGDTTCLKHCTCLAQVFFFKSREYCI